jgi:hypothetical protein
MAISLEFYNVIIPIKNIKKCKEIGGFKGILKHHKKNGTIGRIWYDDYLYRDGAMSPGDTEEIGRFWEKQGLNLTKKVNGEEHWDELCVVGFHEGPTLPCEWLEFKIENDYSSPRAWLKGTDEGKIIGKNDKKLHSQLHKMPRLQKYLGSIFRRR